MNAPASPVFLPSTVPGAGLFERLHAALPQTQCTRCGYPDCAAYAHAIASREAGINQCPPGGAEGVQRLAAITGLPVQALDPAHGVEGPRAVAVIDEAWCIGCTLCLKVCPTDAIFGSNKVMHTVIEPHCTGCELCLPVCPVDCISLENVTGDRTGWQAWSSGQADSALDRYRVHLARLGDEADAPGETGAGPSNEEDATPVQAPTAAVIEADKKRATIEAAMARARARRNNM